MFLFGTSIILTQHMAGSMKVIPIDVQSLPVLLVTVYGPFKSTHTVSHGVMVVVLGGNCLYLFLVYFIFLTGTVTFYIQVDILFMPSKHIDEAKNLYILVFQGWHK